MDDRVRSFITADLLTPRPEHRLAQQAGQPVRGRLASLGPDEHRDPRFGIVREQLLEGGLAEEAGDAGQENMLTLEVSAGLLAACHRVRPHLRAVFPHLSLCRQLFGCYAPRTSKRQWCLATSLRLGASRAHEQAWIGRTEAEEIADPLSSQRNLIRVSRSWSVISAGHGDQRLRQSTGCIKPSLTRAARSARNERVSKGKWLKPPEP